LQEPLSSLKQADSALKVPRKLSECAAEVLQIQANVHITASNSLFDYRFKDSMKEININESQSILSTDVTKSESII